MSANTTTGKTVLLSQVGSLFGNAGANIPPNGTGGTPSIRDVAQSLIASVHPPIADATALTATLAKNRSDGQLIVKLDDYTIWVWKAGSSTGTSGTVIAPTDVGAGAGRWVQKVA